MHSKKGTAVHQEKRRGSVQSIKEKVKEQLINGVSAVLNIPSEKIKTDCDMKDYGFDSISFTGYNNYISEHLNLSLAPNVFMENETIEELCNYICKQCTSELEKQFGAIASEAQKQDKPIEPESVSDKGKCLDNDKREQKADKLLSASNKESDSAKIYIVERGNGFPRNFWMQDMKEQRKKDYASITAEEYKKSRFRYNHMLVENQERGRMEVLSAGKGQPVVLMGGLE